MRDRSPRTNVDFLLLQLRLVGVHREVRDIGTGDPPIVKVVGFLRRTLLFRKQFRRVTGLGDPCDFRPRQRFAVESQVFDPDVLHPRTIGSLTDAEWHLRADRALERVRLRVGRLKHAVMVNLHAFGCRRAIVRNENVRPLVRFQRRTAHHLQRIGGEIVDQVHPDLVGFHP